MTTVKRVFAREILDSRGNPTLECELELSDGSIGVASVPSGASRGKWEAYEKRDLDNRYYHGKGVLSAVKSVNEVISSAILGMDGLDIQKIDRRMIALDGVENKSSLGANAILSVSLALARAGAASLGIPLYRYLGGALLSEMPMPMMNILNGGAHAANNVDVQEFMIVPVGAKYFSDGVRMCSEVYHMLKNILASEGLSSTVGDEGGFAPQLSSDEDAIKVILRAINEMGYLPGKDFKIALDVAASEWWRDGGYFMPKRKKRMTSDELVSYIGFLCNEYPILSIEDGVGEEDSYGWRKLTDLLSERVMLVGDDLFVTSSRRIENASKEKLANAALIKPNQIGTLSEAREAVFTAKRSLYKTVMSHRSGETEDSFIADLAVALRCDYIKSGAPARSERTAKYNRLMKIESEISDMNRKTR